MRRDALNVLVRPIHFFFHWLKCGVIFVSAFFYNVVITFFTPLIATGSTPSFFCATILVANNSATIRISAPIIEYRPRRFLPKTTPFTSSVLAALAFYFSWSIKSNLVA